MDAQETSRPIDLAKIAAASEPQTTGVEERLTALEKKMPSRGETRFLRFGAIAGVLGTLISIVGGVLTIYLGTISRAYENKQKDLHEFEGYIQTLSTEDQKRAIIAGSVDNQASKIAQVIAANTASYVAVNEAELILPKLKNLVTPTQFSLLAEAKAIAGDYNAARTYLANAVSLSHGRERANVLLSEGGILVNSNGPQDRAVAFAAYKEALDIVKDSDNYWGASFVEEYIIAQWLVGEAYVGDCTTAPDLLSRFVDVLSKPDMPADVVQASKKYIYDILVKNPRCVLDLNKIKPDLAPQPQPPLTARGSMPAPAITAPMPVPH